METQEILTLLNTGGVLAGLVLALLGVFRGWWLPANALRTVVRMTVIEVLTELNLLPDDD